MTGTSLDDLHSQWLDRPGYKDAYDALEHEFALASVMIEARAMPSRPIRRISQSRPSRCFTCGSRMRSMPCVWISSPIRRSFASISTGSAFSSAVTAASRVSTVHIRRL